MKEISLIIATYNAGKTLSRCLDSIVVQKTDKVELLIIDGGSYDDTNEIIKSYSDVVDYTISEKDRGLYDAWNKGIKAAKGQWICFLGADDILKPDFFETHLAYLASCDCQDIDIISGKAEIVNEKGHRMFIMGEKYSWDVFKYRMNISHGSTLHNKKLFQEVGLFSTEIRICADYELLLRKKLNAAFIDKILIVMQYGGVSNSIKGVKDAYRVRALRKSVTPLTNMLVLCMGCISFWIHKFINN